MVIPFNTFKFNYSLTIPFHRMTWMSCVASGCGTSVGLLEMQRTTHAGGMADQQWHEGAGRSPTVPLLVSLVWYVNYVTCTYLKYLEIKCITCIITIYLYVCIWQGTPDTLGRTHVQPLLSRWQSYPFWVKAMIGVLMRWPANYARVHMKPRQQVRSPIFWTCDQTSQKYHCIFECIMPWECAWICCLNRVEHVPDQVAEHTLSDVAAASPIWVWAPRIATVCRNGLKLCHSWAMPRWGFKLRIFKASDLLALF